MARRTTRFDMSSLFIRQYREAKRVDTLNDHSRLLWHRLLGSLMGEQNKIARLPHYHEVDDLPKDMAFEREVLRALHKCDRMDFPPTRENVLSSILTGGEIDIDEKNAVKLLDKIWDVRDENESSLPMFSTWVADATSAALNEKAWKVAQEIINSNIGNSQQRQEAAMNIVSGAERDENAFDSGSFAELIVDTAEEADQRYKDREEGKQTNGPMLPWVGFTGAHGILQYGLQYGDQTLVTGASGAGKSVIVGQVAEYNAQQGIADVLVILLETSLHRMVQRALARNRFIPLEAFKAARVSTKDPRFGEPIKSFYNEVKGWPGELNFAFQPGATAYEVNQLMAIYRRRAEASGMPLLVIVDYLYKLNWKIHHHDERVGLAQASDIIRDAVEVQNNKSPLHLIMMHQENEYGEPYGGQGVKQKSQMHISLKRTARQEGQPLAGGDLSIAGEKDVIGNQRYFQRAWDRWESDSVFHINKGNDVASGHIKVLFENSMYRIHNHPDETKRHREALEAERIPQQAF